MYDIAAIINAEPERYPILYKIINTDEYKMYNKMYTGDENRPAPSAVLGPRLSLLCGRAGYNTAILEEVNEGKVPATVDEGSWRSPRRPWRQATPAGGYPTTADQLGRDRRHRQASGGRASHPGHHDWMWTGFVPDDEKQDRHR